MSNQYANVPKITDPAKIVQDARYWRRRILVSSMIGYAIFYIVRKNISLALPAMEESLGIGKAELGLFLTFHGLTYGLSRFTNGFFADLTNPRFFMATGLLFAAGANIGFGMSSTVTMLGTFWVINGWFQGMGFAPCAKSLTNWFVPRERGVKFSIWNTSHSIGAAIAAFMCGYLAMWDWRFCFFIPAGIGFIGVFYLLHQLRDKPESLGLPPVEEFEKQGIVPPSERTAEKAAKNEAARESDAGLTHVQFLLKNIFFNPMLWVLALANFSVYVIRYGVFDWGPTYLKEVVGMELHKSGWVMGSYEIGGIIGMLLGGWLMDKVGGRGGLICAFYMAVCTVFAFIFWMWPSQSMVVNSVLLIGIGVTVYGPQALIGIIAANIGSKRAAASANSITGICGYMSLILSGWGVGKVVEHYTAVTGSAEVAWRYGFAILPIMSLVATILLAITSKVTYHPDER